MLKWDDGVHPHEVTVGILTALPHEARAMASLIDDVGRYRDPGDRNTYWVGRLPSTEPDRPHAVALLMMPRDGTQLAATCCANLLRTFPNIQTVVMTGIAGGIPRPHQPARHVRLGDIVVAQDGIVNYGSVRQEDGTTRLRGRQGAGLISTWLLRAARELQVEEEDGERRWERWLHPSRPDAGSSAGTPRVHYGVIGSADVLMVDEDYRDHLAEQFPDMRAIEMEGSGIAASTAAIDRTWFMVRGVVDYCEHAGKNDLWHPYASYAAAAYLRALLEVAPPADAGSRLPVGRLLPVVGDHEQQTLDTLLRRVPSDFDILPAWQATVPDLRDVRDVVLNTPAQAYHYLARLNADASGLHPAIAFIAHLSRSIQVVDAALGAELWSWVTAHTDAVGTTDALNERLQSGAGPAPDTPATAPFLLIEMAVDGIDRDLCRITPYLQGAYGPWRPRPVDSAHVPLTDVEKAISAVVADAEQVWGRGDTVGPAGIEFLLPAGLLNLPVQWYPASPRLGQVQPICIRYSVAVRSVERMREHGVRREWVNRWAKLDQQPFTGAVQWGTRYQPRTTTVEAWAARLSGDDRYVIVVLSAPPTTDLGRQELFAALAAGVPVVLWDQRLQPPPAGTVEVLQRLILQPASLPAEMRALRVEAEQVAAEEPEHFGRVVALLWDDPNRVVPAGRAGT